MLWLLIHMGGLHFSEEEEGRMDRKEGRLERRNWAEMREGGETVKGWES